MRFDINSFLDMIAENKELVPIIFGIFILFLIGFLFFLSIVYDKKRKLAFKKQASRFGFKYYDKDFPVLFMETGLKLFALGHSKKVANVIQGSFNGIILTVFDYRYTVGYGRNSRIYNQTVAYSEFSNIELPIFTLGTEHFYHKIGDLFGFKDIDFSANEEFSKKFLLKGPDEQSIRRLFVGSVLRFFASHDNKISVQAKGKHFVYYLPMKRIKPKELYDFLSDCSKVVRLFHESAKLL